MKSFTIATALLASAALAQPHHGHQRRHEHDKRELVVEWATAYETVTVVIDDATTETLYPTKTPEAATTNTGSPGQFFQSASTSSTSVAAPSTTLIVQPSTAKVSAAAASPSTTSTLSVAVPTTTSTTPVAVPTTTQAPVAAPTTTTYAAAPASTTAAASSGSGANTKDSDMTYYQIGMGACGYDDAGLDLTKPIVAVDAALWNSVSTATSYGVDQPAHPFCNQEITINYNGKTTTGIVRDKCAGCTADAVDVSEFLFVDLVGATGAGRVSVEWYFNSGKW